jgi:hypothetical protein
MEGKKPIRTTQLGNMKISVWENQKENYTTFSSKIEKNYKDGDEWKKTESLNDNDLKNLNTLIQNELNKRIKTN